MPANCIQRLLTTSFANDVLSSTKEAKCSITVTNVVRSKTVFLNLLLNDTNTIDLDAYIHKASIPILWHQITDIIVPPGFFLIYNATIDNHLAMTVDYYLDSPT